MSDLYFFRKMRQAQWLGLRIPADLQLDVGDDGTLKPLAPWSYVDVSPLPEWARAARLLVLQADGDVVKPVLAPAGAATAPGWQPFQQSRSALAALPEPDKAADLADAMLKAVANPVLPLRLYQAYRDFPAQPRVADYASDDEICLALIRAVGGTATDQPVEAYSELLFIVDSDQGPPAPTPEVDDGDADPARLRVTAHQMASGVTLQLEIDGMRVTNGSVVPAIHDHDGMPARFAPFYRWQRTLGVAERPSADSGPVLIPATVQSQRGVALDAAAWADRPFRLADRLGAQQLAGELLNYEVKLFNPHGRCTHSGRVLLKRQRLDPPAPPLRGIAQLLPPAAGTGPGRCTVAFVFAADQVDPDKLTTVVYRQDYPVVPTGFYGDDDDGALTVARSLGDFSSEQFAAGQLLDGAEYGGEGLPNLSSHNLDSVDLSKAKQEEEKVDGAPGRRVEFSLALKPGYATRLFLALRREVEDTASPPESPVAVLQHMTGLAQDAMRAVPHFERFWGPLPEPSWLGEGAARVMEVEGAPDLPAAVRIVIQHAVPGAPAGGELIGGYRLWLRDVAAPGEETPFHAVALVQAVPRLVKAYAPIEVGRGWVSQQETARASPEPPGVLPQHDFIQLTEPAPPAAQLAGEKEQKAQEESRLGGLAAALGAMRKLGATDNDASLVLGAMQKLRGVGAAREVLLSVAKRRAMQKTLDQPAGNWVFFYDGIGNLLGRAIQFWLPPGHGLVEAELPRTQYRLTETPSAQDTVALDDFGRVAWSWHGLGDLWRHELEWVIEAVPRYAPIRGLRASLGPESGNQVMAVRRDGPTQWHRLVVPRRAPFSARFGLTQVLDAPDDAFVIALDAPHEFRQSLYNSVARTRQGVLRMHPARADLAFQFPDKYDGAGEALLTAWFGGQKGSVAPRPPRMGFGLAGPAPGTYGELVYDEPPCMTLKTSVGASADDTHSQDVPVIGPLRRRRTHTPAVPAGLGVTSVNDRMRIALPLARLDWFYSGGSRPTVAEFIPGAALQTFGELSLLRLPDPEAELLLYFQFDPAKPLRQVAHFRGSALKEVEWNTPDGYAAAEGLAWGEMRTWLGLKATFSAAGDLQIDMESPTGLPKLVIARWRCKGLAVPPITWKE